MLPRDMHRNDTRAVVVVHDFRNDDGTPVHTGPRRISIQRMWQQDHIRIENLLARCQNYTAI